MRACKVRDGAALAPCAIVPRLVATLALLVSCVAVSPASAAQREQHVKSSGATTTLVKRGKSGPWRGRSSHARRLTRVLAAVLVAGMTSQAVAEGPSSARYDELATDLKAHDAIKLDQLVASARQSLKSATTPTERADWDLFLGAALGEKYQASLGSASEGKEAYHMVQAAFAEQPHELAFIQPYARSVRGISRLPAAERFVVTGLFGLRINLGNEARAVVRSLGELPQSAIAQLLLRDLGTYLGDDRLVQQAVANLAQVSAADRVAAEAELATDDDLVAKNAHAIHR
jgi:hypothetical protein